MNPEFLQEQLKNDRKICASLPWSYDMEGHAEKCVETYCELANKTTQHLNPVATPGVGMAGLEAFDFIAKSSHARFWCQSDVSRIGAPRVPQANKDKLVKLWPEFGQELTAKIKVAVWYGMLPKDLQDMVLDECPINWDETTEFEAGRLYTKIKARDGRSENDGSGSRSRLERVARRLAR